MSDVVDKATRSRMMSGIRGVDTMPELFLRKGLHARGFRFRLHVKSIPGRPDIALKKYNALVLINGCFWHKHGCRYCKTPDSNSAFWATKIEGNVRREKRNLHAQLTSGWRCLIVWECAIRRASKKHERFDPVALCADWLGKGGTFAEIDENGLAERLPETATNDHVS